jgi:hypothetical protein
MKNTSLPWLSQQSCLTLLLAAVAMPATFAADVPARAPAVDPAATQILKRMTDYLGSLPQFSVYLQHTLEDMHDDHRVDLDASARAIISRPNKILAEQKLGDQTEQVFYYDGKTLTVCNPGDKVYATEPAPGTIDETLHFVRDSLGLTIPVSDLLYTNAYSLLMQGVTLATVEGKAVIGGVKCNHLLFSRPGVDFQVWVQDGGPPLPLKYVVTDTTTCLRPSFTTVLSDWNTAPAVPDARFTFVPPQGAKQISFLPINKTSSSNR